MLSRSMQTHNTAASPAHGEGGSVVSCIVSAGCTWATMRYTSKRRMVYMVVDCGSVKSVSHNSLRRLESPGTTSNRKA